MQRGLRPWIKGHTAKLTHYFMETILKNLCYGQILHDIMPLLTKKMGAKIEMGYQEGEVIEQRNRFLIDSVLAKLLE